MAQSSADAQQTAAAADLYAEACPQTGVKSSFGLMLQLHHDRELLTGFGRFRPSALATHYKIIIATILPGGP